MLLNKLLNKILLISLLTFILISCSDKENKIPVLDYQNKTQLLKAVQKYYDENVNVAFGGVFDDTGKETVVAGSEVENSDNWGIKFIQLQEKNNEFNVKYETELLEGSFKESFVDKIKFSSFDNELIYYNSGNYYMGSGGGEVFSYIINFEDKQVYYAHLVTEPSNSVSLFISENTENREIINFFTLTFKKDYPDLKIVNEDAVID